MKKALGWPLLVASGVAFACAIYALPPIMVNVGVADLERARADGFLNPAHAAAMRRLDSVGTTMFGDGWQANEFRGHFTYRVAIGPFNWGANLVYIEKPCGQMAIDGAPVGDAGGGHGGGGFDAGGGGGGGFDAGGGGGGAGGAFCTTIPSGFACVEVGGGERHCEYYPEQRICF